jgi:hypothetical protein
VSTALSASELLNRYGAGKSCDICKSVVALIRADISGCARDGPDKLSRFVLFVNPPGAPDLTVEFTERAVRKVPVSMGIPKIRTSGHLIPGRGVGVLLDDGTQAAGVEFEAELTAKVEPIFRSQLYLNLARPRRVPSCRRQYYGIAWLPTGFDKPVRVTVTSSCRLAATCIGMSMRARDRNAGRSPGRPGRRHALRFAGAVRDE